MFVCIQSISLCLMHDSCSLLCVIRHSKVIVERYKKEKLLPAMDKSKFLLPEDLSVAQFSSVVRLFTLLSVCCLRLYLALAL